MGLITCFSPLIAEQSSGFVACPHTLMFGVYSHRKREHSYVGLPRAKMPLDNCLKVVLLQILSIVNWQGKGFGALAETIQVSSSGIALRTEALNRPNITHKNIWSEHECNVMFASYRERQVFIFLGPS